MLDRGAKFEVTIKRVLRITNYFYWFKMIGRFIHAYQLGKHGLTIYDEKLRLKNCYQTLC